MTDTLTQAADRYEQAAAELERAAQHCRVAAAHYRDQEILDFPREGLCWRIHTGDSSARSRVRREAQVPPGGMPLSQASTRTRLRASAVSTCCRWVLARPR
jgi:hypothetical protein